MTAACRGTARAAKLADLSFVEPTLLAAAPFLGRLGEGFLPGGDDGTCGGELFVVRE